VARARLGAHFRLRDQVDIGDATVRRAVADAGRVQAARGVVAALGQVFLRRRIRRDLAARAGIELAVVLDDDLGRRRRRLRRRAAAGGQQGGAPRDGEPASPGAPLVHAPSLAAPGAAPIPSRIARASWCTARAYIGEWL